MNIVGELVHSVQNLLPENYLSEKIKRNSSDTVRKVKKVIPVAHWSFTNALSEILPYAMESVSKKDMFCLASAPKLLENSNRHVGRDSLSNSLDVWVYQTMIVEDRALYIPAMRFSKHSHSVINHDVAPVKIETIISQYRFWKKSMEMESGKILDLEALLELTMLTFIKEGLQLYSCTCYERHGNRYFRISFLKDDMFVEIVLTMDEYHRYLKRSKEETATFIC